jgi:hypothetical protein
MGRLSYSRKLVGRALFVLLFSLRGGEERKELSLSPFLLPSQKL